MRPYTSWSSLVSAVNKGDLIYYRGPKSPLIRRTEAAVKTRGRIRVYLRRTNMDLKDFTSAEEDLPFFYKEPAIKNYILLLHRSTGESFFTMYTGDEDKDPYYEVLGFCQTIEESQKLLKPYSK